MTYIEFFDKNALRNIVACLAYYPDRVIYIGDTYEDISAHIDNCEAVFNDRDPKIEFDKRIINLNSLKDIVNVITEIINQYDDCVFDISGGDELLSFALGMIYAKYPNKNIQVQKYDVNNNSFCDCDGDGEPAVVKSPFMSVDEYIRIFGGKIKRCDVEGDGTYEWDLTPSFIIDVNTMWRICKPNVQLWNTQIGVFAIIAKYGEKTNNGLTVTANKTDVKSKLKAEKASYTVIKGLIEALKGAKLITDFSQDDTTVSITFKDLQIKRCLTTAGLALELKTLVIAKSALNEDGTPLFEHALNGVVIDWDGVFHNERREDVFDTENEIDVFLMNDITPVFISCKNGVVYPEELYKLNTVAQRFGGSFSKKVLVATSIKNDSSGKYFRQRAKDMGIVLIEKVQNMSNKQFIEQLVSIIKGE